MSKTTVWDKLDAIYEILPELPAGTGVTATEFAEHYGITVNAAHQRIERSVHARKMKRIGTRNRKAVYDVVEPKK